MESPNVEGVSEGTELTINRLMEGMGLGEPDITSALQSQVSRLGDLTLDSSTTGESDTEVEVQLLENKAKPSFSSISHGTGRVNAPGTHNNDSSSTVVPPAFVFGGPRFKFGSAEQSSRDNSPVDLFTFSGPRGGGIEGSNGASNGGALNSTHWQSIPAGEFIGTGRTFTGIDSNPIHTFADPPGYVVSASQQHASHAQDNISHDQLPAVFSLGKAPTPASMNRSGAAIPKRRSKGRPVSNNAAGSKGDMGDDHHGSTCRDAWLQGSKAESERREQEGSGLAAPSSVANTSGHLILTILMSVMKSAAGTVPKELWGLSRSLDLVAPRGFVIGSDESYHSYCQRSTHASRYPIVSLRTKNSFNKTIIIYAGIRSVDLGKSFNYVVDVPLGVEKLKFGSSFNQPIALPLGLKALEFDVYRPSDFDHPLTLPNTLRKLTLGSKFNNPITLPEDLEYAKFLCSFNQQLALPPKLKVLDMYFATDFTRPLQLPEHLEVLSLGWYFSQPITLPNSLPTACFGVEFRESVSFGSGLRSLRWRCNHRVRLPNTLHKLVLGAEFQQQVDLPQELEAVIFEGEYNLPLILPSTLKSIKFFEGYVLPLVLPAGCVREDGSEPRTDQSDDSDESAHDS